MAFTCPRCRRTSRHPEDARQGYCGSCHDWTGPGVPGEGTVRFYQCETCGHRMTVPPEHVGRVWCLCGSARAMAPAPWVVAADIEFRPSDIQVVADPSVPAGYVVMANSRGLWQCTGYTEDGFVSAGAGGADMSAVVRYIGEVYGQGVPPPEFDSTAERIGDSVERHRLGFTSLAELRLEVSGYLDQAAVDLITGSQRSAGTDSGDYPALAPDDGGIPWSDSMTWRSGDAEL